MATHYPNPLKPNKIRTKTPLSRGVPSQTFTDTEKNLKNKINKKTEKFTIFRLGFPTGNPVINSQFLHLHVPARGKVPFSLMAVSA